MFVKMDNKIYDVAASAKIDFTYTGKSQAISLPKGKYIIECWGAQGGSYNTYYGGAGGYSIGTLTLTKDSTDLYIYVGGQPASTTATGATPGGFNGGGQGCSRNYNGTYSYGQGGGGATDVRIDKDDLYARIIVAGGGGGSSSENALTTKYGGGTSGGSPTSGYGATQTTAGTNGAFGQGGNATTSGTNYKYGSGGGGGGWYGGGACSDRTDDDSTYRTRNGGGSGYVYTSSTASNYPAGNFVNSSLYLADAKTIAGNQKFKSPTGTDETGHTGNGYCRITRKSGTIYIKQNGSWTKA